jgi:hypothetical protein
MVADAAAGPEGLEAGPAEPLDDLEREFALGGRVRHDGMLDAGC